MTIKIKDKHVADELINLFNKDFKLYNSDKIRLEALTNFDLNLCRNTSLLKYLNELKTIDKKYYREYLDYLYYRFLSAFEIMVIKTIKALRDEGVKVNLNGKILI